MKATLGISLAAAILCGCAGGPPHDYYNPMIAGAHYSGPVSVEYVENLESVKQKCINDGFTLIGTSFYSGQIPKSVEIQAQAHRVGANHVIYSMRSNPNDGSWSFSFNQFGGSGGTGRGVSVAILYFGK